MKVVALTAHEDESYLRQLCKVGAAGYVLKRSAGDELVKAIGTVAKGGVHFEASLASRALAKPDDRVAGERRIVRQRIERAGKGGPDHARLGLQQQGDCRSAQTERQDRRNLQGPHWRKTRSAQPDGDGAIRLAAGMVERDVLIPATGPVK